MAQQPKKKAGAVLDAQLGRYATDQGLHSSASESLDVQAQLRAALAANSVRVMDLFTEWDENRDGVIDKKEFRKAVTSLGVQAPRLHVDALFDSFDTAGSGAIDYKELNKILRRSAKKHAAVAVPGSVQPGVAGKSELARTVSAADAQAAVLLLRSCLRRRVEPWRDLWLDQVGLKATTLCWDVHLLHLR